MASSPPTRRRRWSRRRQTFTAVLALCAALIAIPTWSLGRVLLAHNTDPLALRVVEWARDHHLGGMVNGLENYWYTHHPPPKGGTPKGGIPRPPTAPVVVRVAPRAHRNQFRPANIIPIASPALPGEGVWTPIGRTVDGAPVAWAAYLRPDAVHTSEVIGVVHFDMHHLAATLHAGTDVPGGGPWLHGARVDPADYPRVVAAFNSAFKLNGSHGGYYSEGRTVAPLVNGVASLVLYNNGQASVGIWGRDMAMSPAVASVRQNLSLLVDSGQLAPDLTSSRAWGATVGSAVYVWRSAVGVDARGDLIYVSGPAMDVATLATVMQRAGAVRAMELDINSWWVSLMWYTPDGHGGVTPWKLLPSMVRNPDRYLVTGTRDFVELNAA